MTKQPTTNDRSSTPDAPEAVNIDQIVTLFHQVDNSPNPRSESLVSTSELANRESEQSETLLVEFYASPIMSSTGLSMATYWLGTQADLLRKIITHFYGQMIESDERRMILKTLISEGERFVELAAFYHREILIFPTKSGQRIG